MSTDRFLRGLAVVIMPQKSPKDFNEETYRRFVIPLLIRTPRYISGQAYAFHHIIGEFRLIPQVVRRLIWGVQVPDAIHCGFGPTNDDLLHWYLSSLRQARKEHTFESGQHNGDQVPYISSDDTRRRIFAVAAYALVLASISNIQTGHKQTSYEPTREASMETTSRKLISLQTWFDQTTQAWRETEAIPAWDMVQAIFLKIAWMTTEDAEDVVKLMLRGADGSRTYRVNMHPSIR